MTGVIAMRFMPCVGRLMLAIQHHFNPLHVYCRLVDCGMNRHAALAGAKVYEWLLWSWLSWIMILVIRACRKR